MFWSCHAICSLQCNKEKAKIDDYEVDNENAGGDKRDVEIEDEPIDNEIRYVDDDENIFVVI